MFMTTEQYAAVDEALQKFMNAKQDSPYWWLLAQTLYTGASRRRIIESLPFSPGDRVLDIGTGFGALPFDLACYIPLTIIGTDNDPAMLSVAQDIHAELMQKGCFQSGNEITFETADVYKLPYGDASFDFVVARFVYQHLENPVAASKEILRVLRPGGTVCLIDIDDQLVLTYPEPSEAFSKLQRAFQQLQEARGGDRFVGRKLSTYLQKAGFNVTSTEVQSLASHYFVSEGDLSLSFSLNRLTRVKADVVNRGIMSAVEYDANMNELAAEVFLWQFSANAQVVVTAVKPE